MSARRQGKVITMRVKTMDCLAAIDVCHRAGVSTKKMSFPAVVAKAFSLMCDVQRSMRNIPTRDGFEWNNMMQQFGAVMEEEEKEGDIRQLLPGATVEGKVDTKEELTSLSAVRAIAKDDPELWTEEREERYQQLVRMQA